MMKMRENLQKMIRLKKMKMMRKRTNQLKSKICDHSLTPLNDDIYEVYIY